MIFLKVGQIWTIHKKDIKNPLLKGKLKKMPKTYFE